ncbi:short-chain dehydrogenase [Xylariales sp. PMI_506]|nr:short-chain dehydrogenase [Xylariales sp. PMI_506]
MGFAFSKINAPLTEVNLPDQSGKVFIVTGASGGLGKELTQILYAQNAKIYVAARSEAKATNAIADIKAKVPLSKGEMIFLHLDLDDLTGIKKSAQEFLAKETRLDVLWNNAGVMAPPDGSITKQKYDLQLGTNNVAPHLFTKFLTPVLIETAKSSPAESVRVVWISSSAAGMSAPKGGIEMGNLDYKNDKSTWVKYGISKAGNIFQASEFARRYADSGVISVSVDPGNLETDLRRSVPTWQKWLLRILLNVQKPIYGAYTELYAGLSQELTSKNNGGFGMSPGLPSSCVICLWTK